MKVKNVSIDSAARALRWKDRQAMADAEQREED